MSNFIYDNTALPATKSPFKTITTPVNQSWTAPDANAVFTALNDIRTVISTQPVSVLSTGAVADYNPATGVGTDNRGAFQAAVNKAILAGQDLYIPPGNYFISKYVLISGAYKLRITGTSAVNLYYGSDTLSTKIDTVADTYTKARSCFLVTNSSDVQFDNLTFIGGTSKDIIFVNVGAGIALSRVVGARIFDCRQINGGTLFVQDAFEDTSYSTGNTLAVSAGIVTLTNPGNALGSFHKGLTGRTVTIANATNPVNNGVFTILSVLSSTQLTYANAAAIAESGTGVIWSTRDGDRDTKVVNCRLVNARTAANTGSYSVVTGCHFERPMTEDRAGIPDQFTISGSTVTLWDGSRKFQTTDVGKYIKIAGSTSAGNNGIFQILTVNVGSNAIRASLTYTNSSGVTEFGVPDTSTWWIAGGEKQGLGAGSGAISSASGVVTFTAASAIFAPSDVGSVIRFTDATSSANDGLKVISQYISPTQIRFNQNAAVSESYSKVFSVDSFDFAKNDPTIAFNVSSTSTSVGAGTLTDSGLNGVLAHAFAGRVLIDSADRQWLISDNTASPSPVFTFTETGTPASGSYTIPTSVSHGSSHGLYFFAGRQHINVTNNHFRGIRVSCVKISGTSLPIRDILVADNVVDTCANFILAGADDAQEHTNLTIINNRILDCSINRLGWNEQIAISMFGAKNVKICGNQFHYTHDNIASRISAGSPSGYEAITVTRYRAGISQPVEAVDISNNTFTADSRCTKYNRILATAIHVERAGQMAKYATATGGAPLAITLFDAPTNTYTLSDPNAKFIQQDIGRNLQLVNFASAGNNGNFQVVDIVSSTALRFINASAVPGSGLTAGTYRMKPKALNKSGRGSSCIISRNDIGPVATTAIATVSCLGPDIHDNIFNGLDIALNEGGSCVPRFLNNREIMSSGTSSARIRFTTGTSWPIVDGNTVTNPWLTGSHASDGSITGTRSDMGIGIGNGTMVDYPLLGRRGRTKGTGGRAELVFGLGSELVDGDSITINATVCTYLSTSPNNGTGGTFSTEAGLIALVGSGFVAEDYGTGLTGSLTTGHIRVRLAVAATVVNNATLSVQNVLNPTALVYMKNGTGGGEATLQSRGEGTGEPFVSATFTADNTTDQLTVTAHGFVTGDGPVVLSQSGGALPSGLSAVTEYWVIVVDANNFKLASTFANAVAGTFIDFTSNGSGTLTITPRLSRRLVVWSPLCAYSGGAVLTADNLNAAQRMAGGWYQEKVVGDAGCCEVIRTTTTMGASEFRWMIT